MKKYGLIGYPLTHSFSKAYFTEKFKREGLEDQCQYELFSLDTVSNLMKLLTVDTRLCGLNVTIPYKRAIVDFMDRLQAPAKAIGAVNCIKISSAPATPSLNRGFSSFPMALEGYNTDAFGFEESLKPLLTHHHQKALILGNGGSARAIAYVLKRFSISYRVVSRQAGKDSYTYHQLTREILNHYTLIINTTPLGTFPQIDTCPALPYEYLTNHHILYDLTYNPAESLFLKKGKANGAKTKNGLEMLHLQAEKSWEIWNS